MHQKLIVFTFLVVLVSVVAALEPVNGTSYSEARASVSKRDSGSDLMARGRRKKLFYGLGGLCMIISCHFS